MVYIPCVYIRIWIICVKVKSIRPKAGMKVGPKEVVQKMRNWVSSENKGCQHAEGLCICGDHLFLIVQCIVAQVQALVVRMM